jgi:hypothetical protein
MPAKRLPCQKPLISLADTNFKFCSSPLPLLLLESVHKLVGLLLPPATEIGRPTMIGNHYSLNLTLTHGNKANTRCGTANCCSFFIHLCLAFICGRLQSAVCQVTPPRPTHAAMCPPSVRVFCAHCGG